MKHNILLLFLFLFLNSCGYKAPPDPFFATSPTNVQKEVEARKPKKEQNADENNSKLNNNN